MAQPKLPRELWRSRCFWALRRWKVSLRGSDLGHLVTMAEGKDKVHPSNPQHRGLYNAHGYHEVEAKSKEEG